MKIRGEGEETKWNKTEGRILRSRMYEKIEKFIGCAEVIIVTKINVE